MPTLYRIFGITPFGILNYFNTKAVQSYTFFLNLQLFSCFFLPDVSYFPKLREAKGRAMRKA